MTAASSRPIATALNEGGIPTAAGSGQWQAAQVGRVLARVSDHRNLSSGGFGD
jgi:hypothetical protein